MKSKQNYLRFRPLKCQYCDGHSLHAHGKPSSERWVKVLRFRCADCGRTKTVHLDNLGQKLSALGIKEDFNDLLRDVGLLALGLPVKQVENLTAQKAETIQRRLARCRDEPQVWNIIGSSLITNHGFHKRDFDRLERDSKGEKDCSSPFRQAFASRSDAFRATEDLIAKREALRSKIESILGAPVAYTGRGEYWRADIDAEQIPWIKQIRAACDDELDLVLLGELFHAIALHVRNPNAQAQALPLQRPTSPVMTLGCLCDSMKSAMSLPEFMDGLKEIIRLMPLSGRSVNRGIKRIRLMACFSISSASSRG